jgi:hypothetical protein
MIDKIESDIEPPGAVRIWRSCQAPQIHVERERGRGSLLDRNSCDKEPVGPPNAMIRS